MLKMNYSDFEHKTTTQIIKEADKRGIVRRNINCADVSRNDLIGKIIAHDAYHEGKNDALRNAPQTTKREKYHLEYGDDNYFLKLTNEQKQFFEYLLEHSINPEYAELNKIEKMKFEAP